MSFNIRRFEARFEGVSQKYFKTFFLAPSMDSRMDLISLPSLRAILPILIAFLSSGIQD